MKMKQMPYKMDEGAIERAKYRAKMAVRKAAHPIELHSHKTEWRWASAIAAVAIVIVGVIGLVKYHEAVTQPLSPMEELFAQMQSAPDDLIVEWAADASYYLEDTNSLAENY